jgi:hypothetical protein
MRLSEARRRRGRGKKDGDIGKQRKGKVLIFKVAVVCRLEAVGFIRSCFIR